MSEIPEAATDSTFTEISSLCMTLMNIVQEAAVDPTIVDPILKQQRYMQLAMTFFTGDWTILDKCRFEVSKALLKITSNGTRTQEYISHLSEAVYSALSSDEQISQLFKLSSIADSDPIGHTKGVLEEALSQILTIWMDSALLADNASEKFSDVIKRSVTVSTGKWYDGLAATLHQGREGLQPLMMELGKIGGQKFATKFPANPMFAMFVFPLIINMLNKFYEQYLQEKQ